MTGTELARLTEAVHLLAEARTLDELTHIRNMAQAAEEYARAEKLGDEAEHHAREVRLRAARKAGEILATMAEKGERYASQPGIDSRELHPGPSNDRGDPPSLDKLGLTRGQSKRWQGIARVDDDEFEDAVERGVGESTIYEAQLRKERETGKHRPVVSQVHNRKSTLKQSLSGLRQAAIQLQGLAEALEGQLLGNWSQLYDVADAQQWFGVLEESLPVVNARLKRAFKERSEHGTGRIATG